MEINYVFSPPFSRPLTANTLCVVGVCTCIMMKIAVEKVFMSLGIIDANVEPATEDNPFGSRGMPPDVIFCEPLRLGEIQERMPGSITVAVEDITNQNAIREAIVDAFTKAGWLTKSN